MNAADDKLTQSFVSLGNLLMILLFGFLVFGMLYSLILPTILSAWNAKKMNRRQEKRFNKNRYSNL